METHSILSLLRRIWGEDLENNYNTVFFKGNLSGIRNCVDNLIRRGPGRDLNGDQSKGLSLTEGNPTSIMHKLFAEAWKRKRKKSTAILLSTEYTIFAPHSTFSYYLIIIEISIVLGGWKAARENSPKVYFLLIRV